MEHVLADNVIVKPVGKVLIVERWTSKYINVCLVVPSTEHMTWKVDRAYVNGIGQGQIALKVSFVPFYTELFKYIVIVIISHRLNLYIPNVLHSFILYVLKKVGFP